MLCRVGPEGVEPQSMKDKPIRERVKAMWEFYINAYNELSKANREAAEARAKAAAETETGAGVEAQAEEAQAQAPAEAEL